MNFRCRGEEAEGRTFVIFCFGKKTIDDFVGRAVAAHREKIADACC